MLRRKLEEVVTSPPPWLYPVLMPLSLLYAGSTALHRYFYRSGILKAGRLPRPVVSVGNLTAGGGGKTPIVMWLADTLSNKGIKTAILSRGYGRRSRETLIVDPEGPWENYGDEPSMMAGRLKGVAVAVSHKRMLAGLELYQDREIDLFILDDGFQHRALERDLDIVVIDGQRRFGNGRLLPAGALREPVTRLSGADFIIVTKSRHRDIEFESYLNLHSQAPVLWSHYRAAGMSMVASGMAPLTDKEPDGPFVAFCGIAAPESFRKTLDNSNIDIAQFLIFPDHHPYSAAEVDKIMDAAVRSRAVGLVTTEKDAVRWPRESSRLPVYSLAIRPVVDDAQELIKRIEKLVLKASEDA